MMGRRALLALAAVLAGLAVAPPAWAQTGSETETHVVLTGRAEVRAGERAEAVVIVDGPAVIDGHVAGPVVALNGDIRVSGTVEEAVVAVNGRATILSGARVGGDVVSSQAPEVDPGATVEGETRTVRFSFRALGIFFWLAWWVAVTLSLLVLGIVLLAVVPAAMAASYAVARNEAVQALGWGLLVAVGLPVVSALVMLTIVGIPLGLLGLLCLLLLYAVGYVVATFTLGRIMVREPASRFLAFLAGFVVLRVIGLVPALGGLVTFLAAAYGIGAVVIAGGRAARRQPAPTVVT
ncbi:MAG: polymer-forming cytoskeletal protein [Actinomycetota bacterium]|nr:polymer-forming cytoskeletal protein [Actinomycetota bacterium]